MLKQKLITIGRWLAIIPAFVLAYIISKLLSDWSTAYYAPQLVHELNQSSGLAGYYLIGPLYIFQRESVACGVAVYFGTYTSPKYRRIVLIALLILWFILLIASSYMFGSAVGLNQWTTEIYIVAIIESVAQSIGVAVGAIYAWDLPDETQYQLELLNGKVV